MSFAVVKGELAEKMAAQYGTSVPSIVVTRRHDVVEPNTKLTFPASSEELKESLLTASLPHFEELTVLTFPAMFRLKKPLTIFFDEDIKPTQGAHRVLQEVAARWTGPETVFCWMDLLKGDGIAGKVLLEYNSGAEPPALAHINHQKKTIYNYNIGDITVDKVMMWLEAIERGTIPPSKLLRKGEWKPLNPGYDYLAMLDQDLAEFYNSEDSNNARQPQGPTEALEETLRKELKQIRQSSVESKPPVPTVMTHNEL